MLFSLRAVGVESDAATGVILEVSPVPVKDTIGESRPGSAIQDAGAARTTVKVVSAGRIEKY
jgi:hypothetical protein